MWHEHLEELHFQPRLPRPRGHPKMLYVLHLFSGVKRQDDIHSAIAGMAAREHGILCPISIDIVFDSQTCDLMNPEVQTSWLEQALRGLLFMVIAGPPCETWSVSRLRFLLEQKGPRPMRDASHDSLLWRMRTLRLRELRQILVGNSLLQFALCLAACQAIVANFAVIEHPQASSTRYGVLPPSIWRLACVRLLLQHPRVATYDLRQGLYGGLSPKPTTFLVVCHSSLLPMVRSILGIGRARISAPKALVMGRAASGVGYRTAPLKRYPPALC